MLVADFIRKTREIFNTDGEITEFCFTPKVNGYEISYVKNGKTAIVSIRFRKRLGGMKIKTNRDNFRRIFCSETVEDNSAVLQKIF